jgi:hypothetical protein
MKGQRAITFSPLARTRADAFAGQCVGDFSVDEGDHAPFAPVLGERDDAVDLKFEAVEVGIVANGLGHRSPRCWICVQNWKLCWRFQWPDAESAAAIVQNR